MSIRLAQRRGVAKSRLPARADGRGRSRLAVVLAVALVAGCGRTDRSPPDAARNSHARMLAKLEQIREVESVTHFYLGSGGLIEAEQKVEQLGPSASVIDALHAHWNYAHRLLLAGEAERSLERFAIADQFFERAGPALTRGERTLFPLQHGIAFMRLAENRNCINCRNSESCLFPIEESGVHMQLDPARHAARQFLAVLAIDPSHATARWLLNVMSMATGDYPEGIPEQFVIPLDRFRSEAEFPRFAEVARELGVSPHDLSGGAVIDDFDGDGLLDLVVSTWDIAGELQFYHNAGDGTFVKRVDEAGFKGLFGGLNLIQGDYDNDGDLDLFVLRGAWLGEQGRHPNSLLQNDGKGVFRDVTFDSGMGQQHYPSNSAAFADYDGDGDLDLYVGNESDFPSELWQNDGRGHFANIAEATGVTNDRFAKGVSWGDFDNDDRPDLYVSNFRGANRLYRNLGEGRFEDVAPALGVTGPFSSFSTWFWDYNNDGALDLYVATLERDVAALAREYCGMPHNAELNALYEGDGKGSFRNVTAERNLARVTRTMGANFGDLNNDGFPEMYLGTGIPELEGLMPNLMFLNQRGRRFADVTTAGGFGQLQKGHGTAFGDLDNDGDLDVYQDVGGAYTADRFGNILFENPGFDRNWLSLHLIGTRSNRYGVGARITARFLQEGQPAMVYQWVSSGGSFGANPLRPHVGLGDARWVDELEIHWPASGITQLFRDVPANCHLEITEGDPAIRRVLLPRLKLATRL